MALYIKDPEVDRLANELVSLTKTSKVDAVKGRFEAEIATRKGSLPIRERLAKSLKMAREAGPLRARRPQAGSRRNVGRRPDAVYRCLLWLLPSLREEDRDDLLDLLLSMKALSTFQPIVRLEACFALTRRKAEATGRDKPATPEMLEESRRLVDQFFLDLEAKEILISADVGAKALDAAQQFGKIVNHRPS